MNRRITFFLSPICLFCFTSISDCKITSFFRNTQIKERNSQNYFSWPLLERAIAPWNPLEQFGTRDSAMEPSGTIWNWRPCAYGTPLRGPGTIWNYLERAIAPWNPLEQFGTGAYGTPLWGHGTLWNNLERAIAPMERPPLGLLLPQLLLLPIKGEAHRTHIHHRIARKERL